jgi:hypothetical protein
MLNATYYFYMFTGSVLLTALGYAVIYRLAWPWLCSLPVARGELALYALALAWMCAAILIVWLVVSHYRIYPTVPG